MSTNSVRLRFPVQLEAFLCAATHAALRQTDATVQRNVRTGMRGCAAPRATAEAAAAAAGGLLSNNNKVRLQTAEATVWQSSDRRVYF